jgi:hypothetical protein
MPQGQTVFHGDDVCRIVLLLVVSTFRTIPTVENLRGRSFLFLPKPLVWLKLIYLEQGWNWQESFPYSILQWMPAWNLPSSFASAAAHLLIVVLLSL